MRDTIDNDDIWPVTTYEFSNSIRFSELGLGGVVDLSRSIVTHCQLQPGKCTEDGPQTGH